MTPETFLGVTVLGFVNFFVKSWKRSHWSSHYVPVYFVSFSGL